MTRNQIKIEFYHLLEEVDAQIRNGRNRFNMVVSQKYITGSKYKRAVLINEFDNYSEQTLTDRSYDIISGEEFRVRSEIYMALYKCLDRYNFIKEVSKL